MRWRKNRIHRILQTKTNKFLLVLCRHARTWFRSYHASSQCRSERETSQIEAKEDASTYHSPIKTELKKLLDVGFIRPVAFLEWVSSIVPVSEANKSIRVYMDFKDFN